MQLSKSTSDPNKWYAKNARQGLQKDSHVILFWINNCHWRTSITSHAALFLISKW